MPDVIFCSKCGGQMRLDPTTPTAVVACPHCQAHVPVPRGDPTGPLPGEGAMSVDHAIANQSDPARTKAIISLILGICGVVFWLCPFAGLPINVTGLVLGVMAHKVRRQSMATAGIVLAIIGLVLTIINAAFGAYLGATGQHDFINSLTN